MHPTFGLVFSFRLPWGENVGCRSYIVVKSQNNQRAGTREMKICSMSDITDEVDFKSNIVVLEYHAKVCFMFLLLFTFFVKFSHFTLRMRQATTIIVLDFIFRDIPRYILTNPVRQIQLDISS